MTLLLVRRGIVLRRASPGRPNPPCRPVSAPYTERGICDRWPLAAAGLGVGNPAPARCAAAGLPPMRRRGIARRAGSRSPPRRGLAGARPDNPDAATIRIFLLTTYRGRDKDTHPRSSRGVSGDVSQRRSEAWRPVGRGVTAPREVPGYAPWLEARPRSPNRHGGAPRGERPFERKGTLGASQAPACRAPRHVIYRQRLSALHPPLVGVGPTQTPGAGAPRERTMLFDIVSLPLNAPARA